MKAYHKNTYRFRIMNYLFFNCIIPKRVLRVIGNDTKSVQKVIGKMKKENWIKQEETEKQKYITLGKPITFFECYEEHFFGDYEEWYRKIRRSYYRNEQNKDNTMKMRRLSRLSETSIFLSEAGFDALPAGKQRLKDKKIYWEKPTFYQMPELKQLMEPEEMRATGSRSTGCICWMNDVSCVYSLADDIIKIGEITEKSHVDRIYQFFAKKVKELRVQDAYLFTWKFERVHKKLNLNSNYGSYFYLDDTFKNYYLIPYSKTGRRLINLLYSPDAKEELMDMLIMNKWKFEQGTINIEADGRDADGVYLFNYLIPNIYRFKKFVRAAKVLQDDKFHVFCYDFQEEAVKVELTENMTYSVYDYDTVEDMYRKRRERRESK